MSFVAIQKPILRTPRLWWVVVAGTWFALLSLAALWLIPPPGSASRFTADAILAGSIAATAFLAGALCWWGGFHRCSRLLGTGASTGLGTALIGLIVNPIAWVFSMATFFLWPLVYIAALVLGGVILELAFGLCAKVWPNPAVEGTPRDKAAHRPSL